MKTKLSFLLAALLLISTGAFAQSGETPLKGDVNEDGKVDVADINAIIKIMKDAGGTAEAPTYYWYVGQTDPSTMSSISPIVTNNSSPGWRKIGNILPNYSKTNKLWDGTIVITVGTQRVPGYLAIPMKSDGITSAAVPRDGADNDGTTVGMYTKYITLTIEGVKYQIFKSEGNLRSFDINVF